MRYGNKRRGCPYAATCAGFADVFSHRGHAVAARRGRGVNSPTNDLAAAGRRVKLLINRFFGVSSRVPRVPMS